MKAGFFTPFRGPSRPPAGRFLLPVRGAFRWAAGLLSAVSEAPRPPLRGPCCPPARQAPRGAQNGCVTGLASVCDREYKRRHMRRNRAVSEALRGAFVAGPRWSNPPSEALRKAGGGRRWAPPKSMPFCRRVSAEIHEKSRRISCVFSRIQRDCLCVNLRQRVAPESQRRVACPCKSRL
jgi:hypothetical protein